MKFCSLKQVLDCWDGGMEEEEEDDEEVEV